MVLGAVDVSPPPARASEVHSPGINVRRMVVAALILGAIAWLLIEGMSKSLVYFRTVNQAVADRAQLGNTTFRLEGTVVPGTIRPVPQGVEFAVAAAGKRVSVVNAGSPPQMFAPNMPVVLDGHFVGNGLVFNSSQILIKHTSTYIAAHPNRVKGDPRA